MKKKPPGKKYVEESKQLHEIWKVRTKLSQAEFGRRYNVGNQSYVHQCLTGEVALTFKVAMAFARHLNCLLGDFSPRLDMELINIVNFDAEQRTIRANSKLFTREVPDKEQLRRVMDLLPTMAVKAEGEK